jgi:hypothetical protein
MARNKTVFLLSTLFMLLSACQSGVSPTAEATSSATPTASLTPTETPKPTFTPTWTPPPRLSQEEASRLILELYETNGGCELPCWWGIVPGETLLESALQLLLPIGSIDDTRVYKKRLVYDIAIYVPEDLGLFSSFYVYLVTQNNIIQGVLVEDYYAKPYDDYTLSDYLGLFGEPDQIYVEIHRSLVFFSLLYVEKGIIISHDQTKNELLKATEFLVCPQYADYFYLSIWNPETVLMEDLVDSVVDWQNEFPLEEVSGITPQEFFEIYRVPNTTICIEGQGGTKP